MRKVEKVTVPNWEGNRDAGKIFEITEFPAEFSEKWATRAMLLIENSGQRIPDNVRGLGMVGVAILGMNIFIQGRIDPNGLEVLMDQMFGCIKMIRDPKQPDVVTAIVSADDIEEVQTRLWLRSEVIRVHTGFSPAASLSALLSAIKLPPETTSIT